MLDKTLHEKNRLTWNAATRAHNSHKKDQADFLRRGGSTLFPEDLELLGDVRGSSLVHLLCNSGQDTLSLARMGAAVTGVDISDEAVSFARQLSRDAEIPARFVRQDVYDWLEEAGESGLRFDVAFCSYGAILWLSDLERWARDVARILRPGGRFVAVELHPLALMLDADWSFRYPYSSHGEVIVTEGVGDYVDDAGARLAPSGYEPGIRDFKNPFPDYSFAWGLGDLVNALISGGFVIERLEEYPFMNGAVEFERMRQGPGSRMLPPDDLPELPLMYGVAAHV